MATPPSPSFFSTTRHLTPASSQIATRHPGWEGCHRSNVTQQMQSTAGLKELRAHMRPEINSGCYAFVVAPPGFALDSTHIVASIREPEGLSVILPEQIARDLGLTVVFTAAWITLTVHSDLAAIGLTAAFSQALGQAGISCNVVAGVHHDHLFVPFELAQQAMDALQALSRSSA